MTKINKKNVSVKNGNSETETNKLNNFNFDTSISEKAIGDNELFIFANRPAIAGSNGWYINFTKLGKAVIDINQECNNFDEFITVLFHELGHHVLHSDTGKISYANYHGSENDKTREEVEKQANLFAEHMRHIFYNTIELVKLAKNI